MSQKITVVLLACRQAVPDPALLAIPLEQGGLQARVIPEPCSSKVEVFQMLRTLAGEADLLWVVGCPEDRCLLLEGSSRMGKRVAYAQKLLAEIGLETERVGRTRLAAADTQDLADMVKEIQSRAASLAPNPARQGAPSGKEPL
jgi:coenzyme F420-reducing hydrogenase delta subunit